jgi:hypothetical protein
MNQVASAKTVTYCCGYMQVLGTGSQLVTLVSPEVCGLSAKSGVVIEGLGYVFQCQPSFWQCGLWFWSRGAGRFG